MDDEKIMDVMMDNCIECDSKYTTILNNELNCASCGGVFVWN